MQYSYDSKNSLPAVLVLEDGFTLHGKSFTGPINGGGEVIFNTGMTGYQEILTDPSYCGQMVCMTWPLIGNYGVNPTDWESASVHTSALIVKECCKIPSNWQATESLPAFLMRHKVPGVENIDTRALTLHIRKNGAMRGFLSTDCADIPALVAKAKALPAMQGLNLVDKVAPAAPYTWDGKPKAINGKHEWQPGKKRVLVYDFGVKWYILRNLFTLDIDLLIVPPTFSVQAAKDSGAQGVFLSNGPGDPAVLTKEIEIIRQLTDIFPMAGICLGHQLLGHALGGTTQKLKFGHHGCNHPVKNLITGKIEISSQNHGFHVINDQVITTHINLNDQTVEGFKHPTKPVIAVQHHPEAAPGPVDCSNFFGQFKEMLG